MMILKLLDYFRTGNNGTLLDTFFRRVSLLRELFQCGKPIPIEDLSSDDISGDVNPK